FVLDQNHFGCLDDLARLRLLVELQEAHRHAIRVRIVLVLQIQPLLLELRGPRRVRQTALHVAAGFEERGHRRSAWIVRERWCWRFEAYRWNTPSRSAR